MVTKLTLISHNLCPYVQRAVISLTEKSVPFDRIDVDLANKPDWFKAISPLGKTPVLMVGDRAIFESAVILEYLEETQPAPLHPENPLTRAEHRSWIEFTSSVLNEIWGLYVAPDARAFEEKARVLGTKFSQLEGRLDPIGPYFDGLRFSLVDAVSGPMFRYFDAFDKIGDFGVLSDKPRILAWRETLAARASVKMAVNEDYAQKLWAFLLARNSHISGLMKRTPA